MAFNLESITSGKRRIAPRIVIFGPHGCGKTTWAACAPKPIFIQTEDGLGLLETAAFPLATASSQVHEAISTLYYETHDFQTVVLDSADWLDNLIGAEIRATYDAKEISFGKDLVLIAEQWRQLLDGLTAKVLIVFSPNCPSTPMPWYRNGQTA